jgi:hypothetical protein
MIGEIEGEFGLVRLDLLKECLNVNQVTACRLSKSWSFERFRGRQSLKE